MDAIELLRKNRALIRRRFSVRRIGVFGSHARGEEGPTSDVDILVDIPKVTFDGFMDLVDYLEELLGRPVDVVTTRALSPHIAPIVRKEVVWCDWGRPTP